MSSDVYRVLIEAQDESDHLQVITADNTSIYQKGKMQQTIHWILLVILLPLNSCCFSFPLDKIQTYANTKNSAIKTERLEARRLNVSAAYSKDGFFDVTIEEDSSTEEELLKRVLSKVEGYVAQMVSSTHDSGRWRRAIFGTDNRVSVETRLEAQKYPYSTVVSLSSGCTGTLIGVQHVLTAAHCVHDGKNYLKQAKNLKIGLLQRSSKFRWLKVRRVFVSKAWKNRSKKHRIQHDYAVLELRRPHGRPVMDVQKSVLKRGSPMQFVGVHGDKWLNTMWRSQCRVVVVIRGALLSFCDGQKGISGSGVYVRSRVGVKKAVVGVVSAIGKGRLRGQEHLFNVAISMDSRKVKHINKWIRRLKKRRS